MFDDIFFPDINKQIVSGDKVSYTGILVASKFNQKNGQDYKLLDIVDVDFNGAWIASMDRHLYNSYDLINVLDQLNKSNELSELTNEIEKIWNQINEITSTYITYSALDEILQENWQRKLIAGSYISIDTSNPTAYEISVVDLPTYDYLADNYSTIESVDYLTKWILDNYYQKDKTHEVAYQAAYDAIQTVIDGADNAFDTLKEIADWILDQNRYTPIPWGDVVNDWKEEFYFKDKLNEETGEPTGRYEQETTLENVLENIQSTTRYEYIEENWKTDLYYFYMLGVDGKYYPVTSLESVDRSGDTEYYYCPIQYYIEENYLTDIQNLITRVNRLDDTVGFEEYNELDNSYTYTGHCLDIHNLYSTDEYQQLQIDVLGENVSKIEALSNKAYDTAVTAYDTAYTAYNIAYISLEQSFTSIAKANLAYDMAYDAVIKVGHETINHEIGKIENFEDVQTYIDNGYSVFYYNDELFPITATLPLDETKEYYYEQEYVPGTGLTGRVEIVEEKSDRALETSIVALESSYESLYHLMVNNDKSTYVSLSLSPQSFTGDRNRTLNISSKDASIDKISGYVYSEGLVSLSTAFDIYSYASSWMMLYVDNDITFEELEEEQANS